MLKTRTPSTGRGRGGILDGSTNPRSQSVAKRKKVDTREYSGRVAVRLRKYREKAGLSREQLWQALDAIGVEATVPTIYAWENGSRKIDPDHYPKLAKIFGVPLFEFLPPK